jgi:hypothetical protein
MTVTELINQYKQIASRGYYTDKAGNKITKLTDLPTGITVKSDGLYVQEYKLVSVEYTGDTRTVTYHNTAVFNAVVDKAVDNYNKVVKRNANGLYSDSDLIIDNYGDGQVSLVERFKLAPVAQAISLDDLLAFAKQ